LREILETGKKLLVFISKPTNSKRLSIFLERGGILTQSWIFARILIKEITRLKLSFVPSILDKLGIILLQSKPILD
jgi:preprotein translocase subunit Sec63